MIGERTRLNCEVQDFGSEPWQISIGKDCLIADNVHFITHDGGVKVLNYLNYFDGNRMDSLGKITIGNNVYIGMGAYIMPGVSIGDNCIIGAGAIVTHNIPPNSVAVGVPAKIIETIDMYYQHLIEKHKLYPTAGLSNIKKKEIYEQISNSLIGEENE